MYRIVEKIPRDFSDIMHEKGIERWLNYLQRKEIIVDPTGVKWYRAIDTSKIWYHLDSEGNLYKMTTEELATHCYDEE